MEFILTAVLVLGGIGLLAAIILYVCSKKFAVYEDPRIAQVSELLPGANCGGCGFPGCSGMADALVKGADAGSLDGLMCPVGGAECMGKIADLLGMAAAGGEPKIAVVRCNGTCANRPRIVEYSGLRTCAAMNTCGAGETACGFGCLGCGDCVAACTFDAIHMNNATGLPEVDEEKCVACGACSNVAYIDFQKCKLCKKCVMECPTGAIHAVGFPEKAASAAKPAASVAGVKPAAQQQATAQPAQAAKPAAPKAAIPNMPSYPVPGVKQVANPRPLVVIKYKKNTK